MSINIVLDVTDPQNPIFVEIENDSGESISVGSRSIGDDGLTYIRITHEDIKGARKCTQFIK